MDSEKVAREAEVLLKVMCFFNCEELHEELITGLDLGLVDFPTDHATYAAARKLLTDSGKITLKMRPVRVIIISDSVKTAEIKALSKKECRIALDAAVALLSRNWPWLTTYNATDVERLNTVRKYAPHIAEMRNACIDLLEPYGFMPGLGIVALLHEEAWLESMQTTINDMHLDCTEYGLPLVNRILNYHRGAVNDPTRKAEDAKLQMNQARFVSITSSMIGKADKAKQNMDVWLKMITDMILFPGLQEIKRTVSFFYLEHGLQKLRCADPDPTGACDDFLRAINSFDMKKGVGKESFKFMMPKVTFALFATHFRRHLGLALSKLDELLSEHGQRSGLIVDDVTSIETGVVLYAKGVMTYFSAPVGILNAELIKRAVFFLRRAVDVLKETQGDEAIWTLCATYRLAVCLFDLGQFDEAIVHLDTVNRIFRGYTREFSEHDGADILWLKARALWKGGRALLALGDESKHAEAQDMLDEAIKIYWDVSGRYADEPSMTDGKWDENVFFLYR